MNKEEMRELRTAALEPGSATIFTTKRSVLGLAEGEEGNNVTLVQNHLRDLGYLEEFQPGRFDENTRRALTTFQVSLNLPSTGIVDKKTLAFMLAPRCGRFRLPKRFLDRSPWNTNDLTFNVQAFPSDPDLNSAAAKPARITGLLLTLP